MRCVGIGVLAAAALATVTGPSRAAGVGGGRATEETLLVVWDAASSTEHLLLGAHVEATAATGVVWALPGGVVAEPLPGALLGFASLVADGKPRTMGATRAVLHGPKDLVEAPAVDSPSLVGWMRAEQSIGRTLAVLPVAKDETSQDTGYAHVSFSTPHPVLPFACPDEPATGRGPTAAVSRDHPPRVRLWVELGTETKTGQWERSMDTTGEALRPALIDCYVEAAGKRPLSGDVHVQAQLAPGAKVELEEPTASSKAMNGVAACLSRAVEAAPWPAVVGARAAPFLVHAELRPPSSSPRVWRAFVLSSQDGDPRLGSVDDPRSPPDTRVVTSFEPSQERLLTAFDASTRSALGLDTSRRWRFLVIESSADPRPETDDIVLRPLGGAVVLPPGVPPLPIVTRGDVPEGTRLPPGRRSRFRSRLVRWSAAGAVVLALVGGALLVDRRRRRAA